MSLRSFCLKKLWHCILTSSCKKKIWPKTADFQKTLQNKVITVFETKTLFRDLVMYSHETFMNFVFPPHLVTVIKARVRIQAARLPLYKEDHMKTGWLLIITRKTGLIIIKKKYSSNLNLLHPTSHYHLISSAGGTEVAPPILADTED